jgi:hypothetical protein
MFSLFHFLLEGNCWLFAAAPWERLRDQRGKLLTGDLRRE